MKWAKNWWNPKIYGKNLKRDVKYITRDSVCLYNDSKIKKKRFFFLNFLIIYKKSEIGSGERGMWEVFETKTV